MNIWAFMKSFCDVILRRHFVTSSGRKVTRLDTPSHTNTQLGTILGQAGCSVYQKWLPGVHHGAGERKKKWADCFTIHMLKPFICPAPHRLRQSAPRLPAALPALPCPALPCPALPCPALLARTKKGTTRKMRQWYFCPAEYTTKTKPKTNQNYYPNTNPKLSSSLGLGLGLYWV